MVDYNPKSWVKLIFMFHKSDTFRILFPTMIGLGIFTAFMAYLENDMLGFKPKNPVAVHSLVGFVLSLLLVFRTNTAYDRWWEGRRLWGSFTNNSRNLALKIATMVRDEATKKRFRVLISNFLFLSKEHLRGKVKLEHIEEVDGYTKEYFSKAVHLPNLIMKVIYQEVQQLVDNQTISHHQLLYLNNELQSFSDNLGACERIRKTPIPYSYSLFLKKIIFVYILTMPIGFVLEFKYWAIPIVMMIFYTFASVEILAEEIEDPFGYDTNDLPLDQICKNVKGNLIEILG